MKKRLLGLIGLLLSIVTGMVRADGEVQIYATDDVTIGGSVYGKLVLVKTGNKDDFKGLTGFLMVRQPDKPRWNVTVRSEDSQGNSFCTSLEDRDYVPLVDKQFNGLVLLKDSRDWALMGTFLGLKPDLDSKGHNTSIFDFEKYRDAIQSAEKPNQLVASLLGDCKKEIDWEAMRGMFDNYRPDESNRELTELRQQLKTEKDKTQTLQDQNNQLKEENNLLISHIQALNQEKLNIKSQFKQLEEELEKFKNSENLFGNIIGLIKESESYSIYKIFLVIFSLLIFAIFIYLIYLVYDALKPWLSDANNKQGRIIPKENKVSCSVPPSNVTDTAPVSVKKPDQPTSRGNKRDEEIALLENTVTLLNDYLDGAEKLVSDLINIFKNFGEIFLIQVAKDVKISLDKISDRNLSDCLNLVKHQLKTVHEQLSIKSEVLCEINSDIAKFRELARVEGPRSDTQKRMGYYQILKIISGFENKIDTNVIFLPLANVVKSMADAVRELSEELKGEKERAKKLEEDKEKTTEKLDKSEKQLTSLKEDFDRQKAEFKKQNYELETGFSNLLKMDGFATEEKNDDMQKAREVYVNGKPCNRALSLQLMRLAESLEKYQSMNEKPDFYQPCDLDKLLNKLRHKSSQYKVYKEKDDIQGNFTSEWSDYLWEIFRVVLLIETYWPHSNGDLLNKLFLTRDLIHDVLSEYKIEPHHLGLLDKAEIDDNQVKSKAETPGDGLKNNSQFRQIVQPRVEQGQTYYDVGFWGYNINGELGEQSWLLVKGPGEGPW